MNRRDSLHTLLCAAGIPLITGCTTPAHLFAPPRAGAGAVPANSPTNSPATPAQLSTASVSGGDTPPPLPREFRAAWVASVANIDWPSQRGLSVGALKEEITRIVEAAASLKLNALIVQMRPAGDALYASALEPWSEYLTGEQGRAPEGGFDPLRSWIELAHARGIAIHVWFNPYRAQHPSAKTPLHATHLARRVPEAVVRYGEYLWMDPAHPAAREHSLAVIADVVRRYEIDGVHIDDYFYPYPIETTAADGKKTETPFPDDAQWSAYVLRGGNLTRADWRRSHVDLFVEQLYALVKREKPWVRVGISPFGIGRPDRRPPGIVGFSQYDKLYADVERWLEKGWLDYLAPQLYWPIAQSAQAFEPLLQYWIGQNPKGRHMWPGLYTSRVGGAERDPWPVEEITNQLALIKRYANADGHIHFSMKPLLENRNGIADALRGMFASAAVVPSAPWLDARMPPPPVLRRSPYMPSREEIAKKFPNDKTIDAYEISIDQSAQARELTTHAALWTRVEGQWRFSTVPLGHANSVLIPIERDQLRPDLFVASALSKTGVESQRVVLKVSPRP
jgi:uncharacterized lipoprotein YddW (UPF0748 family)